MRRLVLVMVLIGCSVFGAVQSVQAHGWVTLNTPAPYYYPLDNRVEADVWAEFQYAHPKLHLYAALQRRFDNTESWASIDSFKKNPVDVKVVQGLLASGDCFEQTHGWQYHVRVFELWAVNSAGDRVHQEVPPIADSPIKTVNFWCAAG